MPLLERIQSAMVFFGMRRLSGELSKLEYCLIETVHASVILMLKRSLHRVLWQHKKKTLEHEQ